MSTKRCKIHYRKLRRDNNQFPDMTLAQAITAALNTVLPDGSSVGSKVENRITNAPGNSEYRRLMNYFHHDNDLVFGDVCLFSPGQLQALLQLNAGEEHATLDEAIKAWEIAEKKAPDGTEYLHGITYWMVIGDHFYQIQHVSISTKPIEEYFTWLLRDKAQILAPTQYVELQAEFDRAQLGDDLGDIKSVEIGGLIPQTEQTPAEASQANKKSVEVDTVRSVGDRFVQGFQKAQKILEDLLGPVEAKKIIDSMPTEASLEVKVNISYRAKKRKFQKEFMKNLASGLRNIPDGEILVRGKDGEIKGQDARLSADMNVKRVSASSSLLNMEDVLRQMKEVHRRFLHDGRIQP